MRVHAPVFAFSSKNRIPDAAAAPPLRSQDSIGCMDQLTHLMHRLQQVSLQATCF